MDRQKAIYDHKSLETARVEYCRPENMNKQKTKNDSIGNIFLHWACSFFLRFHFIIRAHRCKQLLN